MCVCLLSLLGACGSKHSDTPKMVTKHFLDAYNNKDESKIKEYSQWKTYSIQALQIQESDYVPGVDKKLQKQVYNMMQSFHHKEGKETISGDHATVKVAMTIYDFAPMIDKGMKEATAKAAELSKKADISDASAQAEINTILFKNMKNAKRTKKKTITINLVKENGKWLVSSDNSDIQNLLIQNMQSLQNVNP